VAEALALAMQRDMEN